MPRPSKTSKDKDEIFDKIVDLLNKFSERSLKTDLANKTVCIEELKEARSQLGSLVKILTTERDMQIIEEHFKPVKKTKNKIKLNLKEKNNE